MDSQEFTPQDFHDPFLDGNEFIEKAIADYYQESSNDNLFQRSRMLVEKYK